MRERLQSHPVDPGGSVASTPRRTRSGWVRPEGVVTVGAEGSRPGTTLEPTRDDPDQGIEGRLVGPVQVLEHDDVRRPRAERSRSAPPSSAPRQRRPRPPPRRARRRPRRRCRRSGPSGRGVKRASHAPHRTRPCRFARAERSHERRLADPRLTGDQHEPSAAAARSPPRGGRRARRARRSARAAPPCSSSRRRPWHMFAAGSAPPPAGLASRGVIRTARPIPHGCILP